MTGYDEFQDPPALPELDPRDKAAAVLLAMGKSVAGKLLKYFEEDELQHIILRAKKLRPIPPQELSELVNEFEDLFSEGTGLMDSAKAIEDILEEGLEADEIDKLLGRAAVFETIQTTVWDRVQEYDSARIGDFLAQENPQTSAYIVSMLPPAYAGQVLMEIPEALRATIIHRTVNLKPVNPRVGDIIEKRVTDLLSELDLEKNSTGSIRVADMMNELEKSDVESLLGALETISETDVAKVRPRIFLFEDLVTMPAKSRVTLFNDIAGDVITTALRGADATIQEAVLSSIGARQRRMIESDLAGESPVRPREINVARRSITQEAIRLAGNETITLRDPNAEAQQQTSEAA